MNRIVVKDVTHLFTKEILLYSLFDMHFKTPMRFSYLAYLMVLFGIWTFPMTLLFWPLNPYTFALFFGLPFFGASMMSKPIWGGKSFINWSKTQILFLIGPKNFYDGIAKNPIHTYKIKHEYTVSRKRDYIKLFQMGVKK